VTGKRQAIQPAEKPDWVDVLLPAALASWGTIVVASAVFALLPSMFASSEDAVLAAYWFLIVYCFGGFLIATVVCTVVGLPALALANWLKLRSWWQAAITGAVGGLLVSFAAPNWPGAAAHWSDAAHEFLFLIAGALAGLAAWRERAKGEHPA
jgi:hypothetical protein